MTAEHAAPPRQDFSRDWSRLLISYGALLLRHRKLVVISGLVFFGVMVVPRLIGRRVYSVEVSFMPQDRNEPPGGLASLAAQFGVAIPGKSSAESPAFYRELILSREILSQVVQTVYDVKTDAGDRATLVDIWDVPGRSPAARIEEATRLLRESMVVTTVRETGTVHVRINSTNPRLAAAIAQRVLDLVNDFNVSRRQSQAGAERRFVDSRMQQARSELSQAERRLADFLSGNRQVSSSSQLRFEQDRLDRTVRLHQEVLNALAQSHEQARISEARNIPVVTLIEQPVVPVSPNRRGLVMTALKALIVALGVSTVIALLLEVFRGARLRGDSELSELQVLWRETLADLRHPVRALRGHNRPALPRNSAI